MVTALLAAIFWNRFRKGSELGIAGKKNRIQSRLVSRDLAGSQCRLRKLRQVDGADASSQQKRVVPEALGLRPSEMESRLKAEIKWKCLSVGR